MSQDQGDKYEARAAATINKWGREEDRKKARAEASEENFRKTFADEMKSANAKKALARAARESVDDHESGRGNTTLNKVRQGGGAMSGDSRSQIVRHEEGDTDSSITGEEPRLWESD